MYLLNYYHDTSDASRFKQTITGMADRLGCNADHLMMCFYFESRLNPHYQTSKNGGTGLIQLSVPDIYKLGSTPFRFMKISGTEQLLFIEKYLQPHKGRMTTLIDTYMACFYQDGVATSDSFYFRMPLRYKTANRIFPLRNNNRVQKWEVDKALRRYFMKLGWE